MSAETEREADREDRARRARARDVTPNPTEEPMRTMRLRLVLEDTSGNEMASHTIAELDEERIAIIECAQPIKAFADVVMRTIAGPVGTTARAELGTVIGEVGGILAAKLGTWGDVKPAPRRDTSLDARPVGE